MSARRPSGQLPRSIESLLGAVGCRGRSELRLMHRTDVRDQRFSEGETKRGLWAAIACI